MARLRILIVLAALGLSACFGGSYGPVIIPSRPQTPQGQACFAFHVRDIRTQAPVPAHIVYGHDQAVELDTDASGNAYRVVAPATYRVTVTADGYQPYEGTYMASALDCDTPISLTPRAAPFTPLPRLRARGQFLEQETGTRFTVIEASDFCLLQRFLDEGLAVTSTVMQQRADAGFNMLRVWTRMQLAQYGICNLTLAAHPDLYDQIPAFLRLAAAHRLYVEFTAYTGREDYAPAHWAQLIAAVQSETNVLLSLVNENDQTGNRLPDLTLFARPPPGVLASHGSNGSQASPVEPKWDYAELHTNGAPEEQRKIGHNAWEIWSGPTWSTETSRYPDVGMWAGSTQTRAEQLAFDSAAGGALLAAGAGCFHSTFGKNSTLWDAAALAVATAWAQGATSVDRTCQDGPYVHRQDLETAGVLRAYERPVPGHACIVRIRQ